MSEITEILSQIESGDVAAAERLIPLIYDQLRQLAAQKLAHEKPGQTLQATALVHEAYVRLVDVNQAQHWDSRRHFFSAAAETMRRILVENARRKKSLKRGGAMKRVELDDAQIALDPAPDDLLALDEALSKLAKGPAPLPSSSGRQAPSCHPQGRRPDRRAGSPECFAISPCSGAPNSRTSRPNRPRSSPRSAPKPQGCWASQRTLLS